MAIENTGKEKLDGTRQSVLPAAPVDYNRRYQDDLNNLLRLYFTQVDGFTAALLDTQGTRYLSAPNGAFHSADDQTAASTTTAYVVTFSDTDASTGVTLVSGSRLTVEHSGRYNVQFSIQLQNTTNAPADIDVWFRKNSDANTVANSNSRFGLAARKAVGDPFHMVGTVNILLDLQASDYVELVWCTSAIGADIAAYSAGTSPTRPAIPSVIATMTYVSRL